MKRRGFLAAVSGAPAMLAAKPRPADKPIEVPFMGVQRYLLFETEEDRRSWVATKEIICAEAMAVQYARGALRASAPTGEIFYICRIEHPGEQYDSPHQHFITHVKGNAITDHLRATRMSRFAWESL